jgi:hypothetical protein
MVIPRVGYTLVGKYLNFYNGLPLRGRKTTRFFVLDKPGKFMRLAEIRWYRPRGKRNLAVINPRGEYCLFPTSPVTIFNAPCLAEIAEFCSAATKEHNLRG